MNDTTGIRHGYGTRLPPPEILAVVTVGPVPDAPVASLRDAVEPIRSHGRITGWTLSATDAMRPGRVTEFLAWRRTWTTTWSMGPVTNVPALLDTTKRIGHHVGADLRIALHQIRLAEHTEELFDVTHAEQLLEQIAGLSAALTATTTPLLGAAIIDDTPGRRDQRGALRTWVHPRHETLLTGAAGTSVALRPDDGMVILYGDPLKVAFRDVVQVDMTGDQALIVNRSGQKLEMPSQQARAVAWLAPNSLRWHMADIPLVEVWSPLLEGLPGAVNAARRAGAPVRFTSDVLSV